MHLDAYLNLPLFHATCARGPSLPGEDYVNTVHELLTRSGNLAECWGESVPIPLRHRQARRNSQETGAA